MARERPHEDSSPVLFTFSNDHELFTSLTAFLLKSQDEAIARRGVYTLANSGGSLPQALITNLLDRTDGAVEWKKWHIFFTDEELVPCSHQNSTFALCENKLLSQAPELPRSQVHTIDDKLLDDPKQLTASYQQQLVNVFAKRDPVKVPRFDLVLLEMDCRGQSSSFVRGHGFLQGKDRWVTLIEDEDSPSKKRITISLHVLNHAHRIVFVVREGGNQDVLSRILDASTASAIRLSLSRNCYFFATEAAAQKAKFSRTPFDLKCWPGSN